MENEGQNTLSIRTRGEHAIMQIARETSKLYEKFQRKIIMLITALITLTLPIFETQRWDEALPPTTNG
ncbi:hypothetical protein M433DRAFT_144506 [Acidomyces richmondensis BFW]|nr:MAG: hypothetical protein FE78DRAFT_81074 [Acidomyces sp. 'richmondensis']KYG44855.1 hypothetical protein M433DRAFT_144506 [Acidomyces richmondensis BFW]